MVIEFNGARMNLKVNFSLTQLEYVLAVHKYGHFAKAAESCLVTQPTLSMQIQKLEDSLGVTIFDRSKKPVLLTEIGQKIISQIQIVLYESRKIESLIQQNENDVMKGTLVIGVIPTVAPYLLPKLLPILEKDFSQVDLQIREMQTHQIMEALDTDEIDVGILAIPLGVSKFYEKALYFEPFSLLCRRDHEFANLKKIKKHSASFE